MTVTAIKMTMKVMMLKITVEMATTKMAFKNTTISLMFSVMITKMTMMMMMMMMMMINEIENNEDYRLFLM